MSPTRRLRLALLGLVLLTAAGTGGYMLFEGASLIDALFMTVTTLSTVGYGEIVPLDLGGRVFTMALIVFGVGTALYLLTAVAELVLEGHLQETWGRSRMHKRIEGLKDHVVVCGFGRFGRAVVEELQRRSVPIVIVDSDPEAEPGLRETGAAYLIGSALSDEVIESAGIARARALVIATASDPDNVFVTLSAREKNPGLRIHSRAETDAGLRRLRLAGADQVVSAYQMGGIRVASSILRPSVIDAFELSGPGQEKIDLEELRVAPESSLGGRTVEEVERAHPRLRVVAWKGGGDGLQIIPEPGTRIGHGDVLVAIGDRASLERLALACSAGDASH
ncbi:MAG: potassium channel family protein [Alphaproteobacteria bacterium]